MKKSLQKKRERPQESIIITLGKTKTGYFYITDSLISKSKIKISMKDNKNESKYHIIYNLFI